jgi:hypothetical protein
MAYTVIDEQPSQEDRDIARALMLSRAVLRASSTSPFLARRVAADAGLPAFDPA